MRHGAVFDASAGTAKMEAADAFASTRTRGSRLNPRRRYIFQVIAPTQPMLPA